MTTASSFMSMVPALEASIAAALRDWLLVMPTSLGLSA
jgi:hypothetical protein